MVNTVDSRSSQIPCYLLNSPICSYLFVTPRSIGRVLSQSFAEMRRAVKILSYPKHVFPAEGGQGVALPSRLSFHIYTGVLSFASLGAKFFSFLPFVCLFVCLVILLFSMIPKHSAAWCSSVRKAVTCLTEKISAFDELCSDGRYGAVGHEFNGKESAVDIKQGVFIQKHT